jgi:superfamily I DNA/RNA helicase
MNLCARLWRPLNDIMAHVPERSEVSAVSNNASFSAEQWTALRYDGGNAYVAAGPGTGKTHLLVGRYLDLLERGIAPERIVVLTFSRRAADELRERIVAALAAAAHPTVGVEVRTFHGFGSRLLQGQGARFKTRRLLDGFTRELLLDALVATEAMTSLSEATRASRAFRTEATRLLDDIGRASADGIAGIRAGASARLADLLRLRDAFAGARERLCASDLNDLVARAVQALANPQSEAALWLAAHRYEHVLVDEFQDTDIVQLDLLEALGGVVFAVGDEAQSIYRFRGAQHGIIAIAQERLRMERFALTVSRRCPPAVCELAAGTPFVAATDLRSARTDGPPVVVAAVHATADEVHLVADTIEDALDAGTRASEIAVLLRSTRPVGPLIADELRRRSIPVVENSRDKLLSDTRVSTLLAAFSVLGDSSDVAGWRRLLTAQPLAFDPLAVRLQHKALAAFRPNATLAASLDAAGLNSAVISSVELASALSDAKTLWDEQQLGKAARLLARKLKLVAAIMRDEDPANVRSAAARLKTLCDGLAEAQRSLAVIGKPATCTDIVEAIDDHLSALAGAEETDSSAVRILSVHAAKGLEFELVVLADAVDGRFPQHARSSSLLSEADRSILLEHGVDGASVTDAVEQEEASLWFVAVTRTKSRLVITYSEEGLDGREHRPSRFLAGRTPEERTRVARGSLEIAALRSGDAAWRTSLRSERRVAASPSLSAYAESGCNAFQVLDTRPLPLPRSLSVGNAVDWLQCPRKLFYGRFLEIRSEESTALTLGNALHDVLERFHERERDFTNVAPADIARWTTSLQELRRAVWEQTEFEGSAIHEATGIFADRALAGYAGTLERRAANTPFVVEQNEDDVNVPIGPMQLRGRIDRIDRRVSDNKRLLVDYKSGSAKKKPFRALLGEASEQWDAGESLAGTVTHDFAAQLAFYASALEDVGDFAYIYLRGSAKKRAEVLVDTTIFDEATQRLVGKLIADITTGFSEPLRGGTMTTLPRANRSAACTFCTFIPICPGAVEDDE